MAESKSAHDEWERLADERERIASERDRVANNRDDIADQREAATDARDAQLDEQEKRLANLELTLDERARALREAVPDMVRRQQEAIDRCDTARRRGDSAGGCRVERAGAGGTR